MPVQPPSYKGMWALLVSQQVGGGDEKGLWLPISLAAYANEQGHCPCLGG